MVRPGCDSFWSYKLFLAAYSTDTVLKPASITNELCSINSESKTKAKSCHETEMPVSVSLPLLLHIYFHDSRSFFLFLKDGLNAPFTLYNLSCMSLGHSTYHRQQSVQLSVMVVIIFSISPHTSPEQVLNGFTSFALQQLENAPLFWAKKCLAWRGVPNPLPPGDPRSFECSYPMLQQCCWTHQVYPPSEGTRANPWPTILPAHFRDGQGQHRARVCSSDRHADPPSFTLWWTYSLSFLCYCRHLLCDVLAISARVS